ncbi:MAG: DUF5011 domain-containing protein [Gammaproteobacteria bacterium]|nr:DUF5011 domain-containing protein [Gammaproteobacteria bacterium]
MKRIILTALLSVLSFSSNAATGIFKIYDAAGVSNSSDPAVVASIVYPGTGSTIASPTPFFEINWYTHDITTYQTGTYTVDTIEGGVYTFTVDVGQIGAHMLFDWAGNNNIDVINVWDVTTASGVVYYTSTDWDGDGVLGGGMIDGPFLGMSVNFDLEGSDLPLAANVPAITLNGSATVTVQTGTTYVDAGATANDIEDGDLTSSIITTNPVNTSIAGTYTVSYNVADADSNTTTATRTVNVISGAFPVITLNGTSSVTTYTGTIYLDAGATASDVEDGDLTTSIVTTNSVNTSLPGTYTVSYSVMDSATNTTTATRTVDVITGEIPIISLLGSASVTISMGDAYTDAGATATDVEDGNMTTSIVTTNAVNTSLAGDYNITYNVTDSNGNAATEVVRIVHVVDPNVVSGIFTMYDNTGASSGSDNAVVASIVYPGAGSAIASPTPFFGINWYTHDITTYQNGTYSIETVEGGTYTFTVGVGQIGVHMLFDWGVTTNIDVINVWDVTSSAGVQYYTSTDWDGDTIPGGVLLDGPFPGFSVNFDLAGGALPVVSNAPSITLMGSSIVTLQTGATYIDAGATAIDTEDGNLTSSIVITNPVNTSTPGTYTVSYSVTDADSNTTVATRTVNVITGAFPVLTLNGTSPATAYTGSIYLDAGITASDIEDGSLTASVVTTNSVNTSVVGSYTVTYSVTDSDSNTTTMTRTVNVITGAIPVISLSGSSSVIVSMGNTYFDAGATASDLEDGNLSASIVVNNSVNTSVAGTYTVTYNLTDSNGNTATQVTRTVNVIDPNSVSGVFNVYDPTGTSFATDTTIVASIVYPGSGSTIASPTPFFGLLWKAHDINTYRNGTYTIDTVEGGSYTFTVGVGQIGVHMLIDWGVTTNMDVVNVWDVASASGVVSYTSTDWDADGVLGGALIEGPFIGMSISFDLAGGALPEIPVGNTPPDVYLNGASSLTLYTGDTFVDPGVTASDVEDGDLSASLIVNSTVNTATTGKYTVTYTATDTTGYAVSAKRNVTVVVADADNDGLLYLNDNCTEQGNADQRDTDADGFGNVCDSDLNGDGIVNSLDLGLFKQTMFSANLDSDINGDGIVNSLDIGLFKQMYFKEPGPSGL